VILESLDLLDFTSNRFLLSNYPSSVIFLSMKTHRFIKTRAVKSGFSLTEMLIVVAIILVLSAIAIVSIRSSREKAASAVCAQNLRQIGVGLHSFISENNGRFPEGTAYNSYQGQGLCWYDAAAQYMGRPFVSPLDRLPKQFGCPAGHGEAYEPS
jgi:prepilin-type N-terminal cleavage/methylation domain-containing protein